MGCRDRISKAPRRSSSAAQMTRTMSCLLPSCFRDATRMTNVAARGSKTTTDLGGPQPDAILSFGPFRLAPLKKALFENECPLRLGSRALDILTLLVRRAGGVVTKEEIIREVWPDTFVEETNLRVNIAALRKALGDGRDGRRYIVNIPGRGYCFTAPVSCLNVAPFFEAKISDRP